MLLVLAVLLIAAGIISAIILDRRLSGLPEPKASSEQTGSTSNGAPTEPKKLTIANARDFDPQGEDKTENPDEVVRPTMATRQRAGVRLNTGNPKLGNLKRGVGLVLDLDAPQPVPVKLRLSGAGTAVEFRSPRPIPPDTEAADDSDKRWRTVAAESNAGESATLTAEQDVTTRYVLVFDLTAGEETATAGRTFMRSRVSFGVIEREQAPDNKKSPDRLTVEALVTNRQSQLITLCLRVAPSLELRHVIDDHTVGLSAAILS